MLKTEDTLYKLDIFRHRPVVFFHLNVSLYGRLFNKSFRLFYLRNIFTAFAIGLSGYNKAKLSLPSIFGYLGNETKNTAEHVISFTQARA